MHTSGTGFVAGLAAALLLGGLPARAEEDAKVLTYGVGLRSGGGYTTQATGDTVGIFTLDVRPYISGQLNRYLKFEGNLDLNRSDESRVHVLDAVAKLEPDDLFNVWFGRFLPPSDRANLSGPYYQNAWNFPDTNGYPSIFAGRADGAALWGQVNRGQVKYQAGYFTLGPATPYNQGIYAGRLTLNVLDPESGYYNSSTYYGSKRILALGGAIQYQKLGGGTPAARQDLTGYNADLLFETPLAGGDAISLEGAYYNFNHGSQGSSFFALASYLLPTPVGIGKLQPMARYQQLFPTAGDSTRIVDGGLNYVIDGHKARLALVVQNRNPPAAKATTTFQLGVQFQE